MPQTVTGEGYRDFSEPRFFECLTESQVQLIRQPVDKAHAMVAAADGSTNLAVWKFDAASTAAASATIIVPLNPAYATLGRWINLQVGSGSGGGGGLQTGAGSPEGLVDASDGRFYWDTSGSAFYLNPNTSGTTGWVSLVTL